jgi:hypothetical protein
MIYYTFFFANLGFSTKRLKIQNTNIKLDKMRKIPIKTLDEQKTFIGTKYPKKKKFVFTWSWLGKVLLIVLITIFLYRAYNELFKYLSININLWQLLLIIILFPIIVNLFLRLFNLETDDLTIFFR